MIECEEMLLELTKHKLDEELTIRSINIKKDFEKLIPFYDTIFEKELSSKGTSIRTLLEKMRSMASIFSFLGLFNKNLKHLSDGFIIEDGDNIAATIMVGYTFNFWEISMVATNPEYRRRGLARKLVNLAIEHARKNGAEMCVLEVLDENTPAYDLYKDVGFVHFDTSHKLIMDPIIELKEEEELPEGYILKNMVRDKRTNQDRLELDIRSTSQPSQEFLPIDRKVYFKPFLVKLIRPLAMKMMGLNIKHWLVYEDELLVASVFLNLTNSEKEVHNLEILADPEHENQILLPLLNKVSNYVAKNDTFGVKIASEIKSPSKYARKVYKDFGFEFYETDHILGLKLI